MLGLVKLVFTDPDTKAARRAKGSPLSAGRSADGLRDCPLRGLNALFFVRNAAGRFARTWEQTGNTGFRTLFRAKGQRARAIQDKTMGSARAAQ